MSKKCFYLYSHECYNLHMLAVKNEQQVERLIASSVFPLCHCRRRTSCMTWCQTWTREGRTWRRGLRCWKQSWKPYWLTCKLFLDSSARSSTSSTGTSWKCSSSLMTNTALSAHSRCHEGGHPLRRRRPPRRAARVQTGNASAQDFCHHMAKLHLL